MTSLTLCHFKCVINMFCEGDNTPTRMRRVRSMFKRRTGSLHITSTLGEEIRDISTPTGFKHNCHVGFDNGQFVGLPPAWNLWLQSSKITCVLNLIISQRWWLIRNISGESKSPAEELSILYYAIHYFLLSILTHFVFVLMQRR